MNKTEFDNIIRTNLSVIDGEDAFGYVTSGKKTYFNYYCADKFESFCSEMKDHYPEAYEAYRKGKGSELNEHNSKYGKIPPKMASVGSSSRFGYLALRDGAVALGGTGNVKFEYECKIRSIEGTSPQLDAFIEEDLMFFEVKCHEIFDYHKITMKKKYWDKIYGRNNQFGLMSMSECNEEAFDIPLFTFGIEKNSTMFDIKQFLCHLLGVASYNGNGRKKKLIYLFFKPLSKSFQDDIDTLFDVLRLDINTIFSSEPILKFCNANQIELQAFAEEEYIMKPLTDDNIRVIYK